MLDLDADALRGVHRRAAADRDEPVAAFLAVDGRRLADELDVGVRAHAVEDHAAVQRHAVEQAGTDDSLCR